MLPEHWKKRFRLMFIFDVILLAGLALVIPSMFGFDQPTWFVVTSILACVPGVFYTIVVTLWHWKARYRGNHSDLWGGLLILETTGWFKLVYLFRHIIPDARGTGRYNRVPEPEDDLSLPTSQG